MQIQEFARKVGKPQPKQVLYAVDVFEGGAWITLPERHHKQSLAFEVACKERKSRQCHTRVRLL